MDPVATSLAELSLDKKETLRLTKDYDENRAKIQRRLWEESAKPLMEIAKTQNWQALYEEIHRLSPYKGILHLCPWHDGLPLCKLIDNLLKDAGEYPEPIQKLWDEEDEFNSLQGPVFVGDVQIEGHTWDSLMNDVSFDEFLRIMRS